MQFRIKEPLVPRQSQLISGRTQDMFQIIFRSSERLFGIPAISSKRSLGLTLCFLALFFQAACTKEDPEVKFKSLMDSAATYKKEEKWDEARIQLQNAIEVMPKSAPAYFELAEVLIRQQKIRQAVEAYNSAIDFDPSHREARLHLASILLAAREFDQAENHVTKLMERNPNDVDAQILQANIEALGNRKNYEKARAILTDVLNREPENLVAIASLATVELSSENVKEAESQFARALKIQPNNAPVQMALADLFARQGRLDEAQEIIESLVKQNPDQSGLRYVFGEFLLRRGLGGEASEQYEATLKQDPSNLPARDRLYDMHLARQEADKAKALTDDLIAKKPDDPGVAYFKGRNLEIEGKLEEALQSFLDALKLVNNFAPVFRRAGLIELRLGKEREAIEHLNQAVGVDAGDVGARLALARVFFAKRDFGQATEHLNQILQRYPRQLGANILSADIALIEGNTDKARTVYEFLVQTFPNNPIGSYKMGLVEERDEHFDKAIEWYRKTLNFDRGVLGPARRLVTVLSRQNSTIQQIIAEIQSLRDQSKASKPEYDLLLGSLVLADTANDTRFEVARDHLVKALEGDPNLIGAYFALGAIDSASGDTAAAIANYDKLLEKNPTHVPTLMLLALSKEKLGSFPEAAEVYRKILATNPRFGPAANNLAWLLAEEISGGDLDEALRLAEVAKEELPKEPSVADTLGWIHFKRGTPRAAAPLLQEAIELHEAANSNRPVNPEIVFHLAKVKVALEEKDEAKRLITQALSIAGAQHPKHAEMKELADSLQ